MKGRNIIAEFPRANPGCLSSDVENRMHAAIERARLDPDWFCGLEGCGPVEEFEHAIKPLVGGSHVLAVSSGTAALHTAALVAGFKSGDWFIAPAISWPQSVAPFTFCGARPLWVDIDPDTGQMDLELLEQLITSRVKAIIAPHLFGSMIDMAVLQSLAQKAGVLLISDAAQAMGAKCLGAPAGDFGDMACFSLGRGKLVSAGEGGVITFRSREDYERAIRLTQHPERYFRETGNLSSGFALNYRMHPWQALAGLAALDQAQAKLEHRRSIYKTLVEQLSDLAGIHPLHIPDDVEHAAYGVMLRAKTPELRAALLKRAFMAEFPLEAGPITEPLNLAWRREPLNPYQEALAKPRAMPHAEKFCYERQLWMMGPLAMDGISESQASNLGKKLKN